MRIDCFRLNQGEVEAMVWSQLAVPGDAPRFDDADDDGEEDEDGDMHPI